MPIVRLYSHFSQLDMFCRPTYSQIAPVWFIQTAGSETKKSQTTQGSQSTLWRLQQMNSNNPRPIQSIADKTHRDNIELMKPTFVKLSIWRNSDKPDIVIRTAVTVISPNNKEYYVSVHTYWQFLIQSTTPPIVVHYSMCPSWIAFTASLPL